jgi:glutamate racemase
LFVPLVEEGWLDHPVTRLTAEEYLRPLRKHGIDTLVLGCTHYPLLKNVLQEVLGPEVVLIDSAEETAFAVATRLQGRGQLRPMRPAVPSQFFVTDVPERFQRVGGEFLGHLLTGVEQVSID